LVEGSSPLAMAVINVRSDKLEASAAFLGLKAIIPVVSFMCVLLLRALGCADFTLQGGSDGWEPLSSPPKIVWGI
jgi:hypothetical protein